MPRVVIDPRLNLPYYTYFLQGFADLSVDVQFKRLDAPCGAGAAMLYEDSRIWVDTNDMVAVDESAYEWCDVFAKVNCDSAILRAHPKLRLLGPVFGIRRFQLPHGYLTAARMVIAGGRPRPVLQGMRFQGIAREPITVYTPSTSESGFVYHRSRAWSGKHAGTNAPRERFIEALDGLELLAQTGVSDDRVPLAEYLEMTKRSAVVFNCPAVHACLGWKLGEYLALGKAIISVPLGRELPAPLVHGEHIHFVDDDVDQMREAVVQITADRDYRRKLEWGARDWYDQHLCPSAAAKRVLAPTS